MAYNYNYDIATSRTRIFFKLLLRWRGSVWEAVYIELIIWLFLYAIIAVIYRCALTEHQQDVFEKFAQFCDRRLGYIPMNFMLGFFVTTVVNRWMTQFANLGMIDNIALFTSCHVRGNDERGRQMRRNICRYCVLSQALVFRDIHLGVRKRFPTLDTLVAAGFMLPHEQEKFNDVKSRYAKYWLPFNWSLHLLNVAKSEGRIEGDIPRDAIAQEIRNFRTGLSLIWTYDWVPLPIMYPQLIYMAVYTYFFVCLFSRQFIIRPEAANSTEIDLYVPFMSSLELIFYMGWLKVAMALLNPFGEDEDDFDCNFLLDRNLTVSMGAVDDAFDDVPEIQPDIFWNDTVSPLYSKDAAQKAQNFYMGSANKAELPEGVMEVEMVPHPVNERIDHYIQNPARRRRTSIVSILRTPKQTRMESISSQVANVFRNRKNTGNSEDIVPHVSPKPRSSTDGNLNPQRLDPGAYNNPTFLDIDEPRDDALSNGHPNSHRQQQIGGNVRSHIQQTRSFNYGPSIPEEDKDDSEIFSIEPYLVFHHDCNVKKPGCTRETKFEIPKSKIDGTYEMTYVTLDIVQYEDKNKC